MCSILLASDKPAENSLRACQNQASARRVCHPSVCVCVCAFLSSLRTPCLLLPSVRASTSRFWLCSVRLQSYRPSVRTHPACCSFSHPFLLKPDVSEHYKSDTKVIEFLTPEELKKHINLSLPEEGTPITENLEGTENAVLVLNPTTDRLRGLRECIEKILKHRCERAHVLPIA